MEEYKDLKRDLEKFNKKSLDNNSIYQLQSIDNENYIQIVQVGEGFKSNYKQVHVNDFKIKDYNCIVVSLLYKKDDINFKNYLNMLQVKVKKETDTIDKAFFIDFFCKINENQTLDLSSNKKLECKYGVKVIKDNKENIVTMYDKYPGKDKMIELLLKELLKLSE
jgi:hypothetical protein